MVNKIYKKFIVNSLAKKKKLNYYNVFCVYFKC